MNNENNCGSSDAAIGIGFGNGAFTAGSVCSCCASSFTYQGQTISSGTCSSRSAGFRLYLVRRTSPVYDTHSCKIQETSASVGPLSNSAADAFSTTVVVHDGQLAITGSWNEKSDSGCDALSYVEITRRDHDSEYYFTGQGYSNGCAWSSLWGSGYSGFTHDSCREYCNSDFECTGYMYAHGWCDLNTLDMTNCPQSESICNEDKSGMCQYSRGQYIVTVNTGCTNSHIVTLEDPQLAHLSCPSTVDKTNWYTTGEDNTPDTFKIEQSGTTMTITRTDASAAWCMNLKLKCFHSSSYKIAPTGGYFRNSPQPATSCIDGDWNSFCHSDFNSDQLYIDIPYSRVSKVKLHNRADGLHRKRQIGVVVSVNGVVCGTIDNSFMMNTILCPNVPGNKIMLSQPRNEQMNFQQVEVFGTQVPKRSK